MRRLLFLLALAFPFIVSAQDRTCHYDEVVAEMRKSDPNIDQRLMDIRNNAKQWAREAATQKRGQRATIFIPTVVHVMHNGEAVGTAPNISDDWIMSQIAVLNEDYQATNADLTDVPSYFQPVIGDMDVQFVMAILDPNGNSTNGIDRVDMGGSNWSDNQKPGTIWNPEEYLNIWVADLGGNPLGYATPPGGNPNTDGVVCDYRYYGRTPDNPLNNDFNLGRTATHEVGHWLNLAHTFQGSCSGTTANNCGNAGDGICDTPPTDGPNYGCFLNNVNTCTETPVDQPDMQMNYMDYLDDECLIMFTQEQADVMLGVLNTVRSGILTSPASGGAGAFSYSGQVIDAITNQPVANAGVVFASSTYTFELTTDANGNFSSPAFRAGSYTVYAGRWGYMTKLYDLAFNLDSISSGLTIPIDPGVYYDDFLMDFGWISTSNQATTGFWSRGVPLETTSGGEISNPGTDAADDFEDRCYVTGNGGGGAGNDDVDDGTVILISPIINATLFNDPYLTFESWFYNGGGNGGPIDDTLTISLSNGINVEVLEKTAALANNWSASKYRMRTIMLLTDSMRLIVETADLGDGHLVEAGFDFFRVGDSSLVSVNSVDGLNDVVNVYPNPTTGRLNIAVGQVNEQVSITVFDMVGKQVYNSQALGSKNIQLDLNNSQNGTYFVQVRSGNEVTTKKVSLLK